MSTVVVTARNRDKRLDPLQKKLMFIPDSHMFNSFLFFQAPGASIGLVVELLSSPEEARLPILFCSDFDTAYRLNVDLMFHVALHRSIDRQLEATIDQGAEHA